VGGSLGEVRFQQLSPATRRHPLPSEGKAASGGLGSDDPINAAYEDVCRDLQRGCQLDQRFDSADALSSLDQADLGSMEVGSPGELFLR
jgi:hypothetical protein